MANAVAKATETSVSMDVMDDIFEMAGEGATFDSSEMQIPFVRVLQALSPQLNKKKPEYIEGASSGDMYNTVTNEYWDGETGVVVIPCYQTTKYLLFTPREQGGGFLGEVAANDPMLQRTVRSGAKELMPDGSELVKSDQHYCLILNEEDGSFQPAVIDMKSTQLKVSRRWKTQIAMQKMKHPKTGAMITPPLIATMWRLRTTEESNDQGSWSNYNVEKVDTVSDRDLLMEANVFRKSISDGEVKAAAEPVQSGSNDGDEIPF